MIIRIMRWIEGLRCHGRIKFGYYCAECGANNYSTEG